MKFNYRFEKLKGFSIHLKLRGLGFSKVILDRNYICLLNLQKYFIEHRELIYVKNRDKLENFEIEFMRLLHNYLGTVKSLIDHTRVLKKKLELDSNFEEIYEKKRKQYLDSDTIYFIQNLREYCQHYQILPVGFSVQIKDKDADEIITLMISKSSLEEYDGWNSHSKKILNEFPQEIDIFKLMSEYQFSVNEFYKWFLSYIENLFKKELSEFDKAAEEYKSHFKDLLES